MTTEEWCVTSTCGRAVSFMPGLLLFHKPFLLRKHASEFKSPEMFRQFKKIAEPFQDQINYRTEACNGHSGIVKS